MIGWLLLVAVVSGAACFTIGHRTARIRIIPIPGGPPAPLHDGVIAVALAGACCDGWWATAGAGHDQTCPRQTPRSSA